MTVNQIQRLLHEVQTVLTPTPRLPWRSRAQAARQRQILEQVYLYLQQCLAQVEENAAGSQAQTVMQSLLDEMNALRSTLLRPLHAEVATLMQQRHTLIREIRQLEAHRQLIEPSAMAKPQAETGHDRIAQDLNTLDTTLHHVFESLQNDIQAYQASLSQGIDKLHTLGRQSEAVVSQFVERLATQIEQASPVQVSLDRAASALAMPYAGTELSTPPSREAIALTSIAPPHLNTQPTNTIQALSELVDQLAVEVNVPVTVPAVPPENGTSSGLEAPPELKLLFEPLNASANTTDSNSIIQAVQSNSLSRETTRSELGAKDQDNSRPSAG